MRLAFAGTGAFGVPTLEALVAAGHEIALVISQPDRPAGRAKELLRPPLAAAADRLGLPLFQPERINRADARTRLAEAAPEVLVVVSFGQILRRSVLDVPALGCLNLHGSLLPRHRGASPIQAAILAGDRESGNTVMLMDEGMDTGPMLAQEALPIGPRETAGELHDRLARAGAPLFLRTLEAHAEGRIRAVPQDDALATLCGLVQKEHGRIRWSDPARDIDRLVRAMTPWPGAFTELAVEGAPLRLLVLEAEVDPSPVLALPGTVVQAEGERLVLATGKAGLRLVRVKPAGKRSMDAAAFLRGYPVGRGSLFGGTSGGAGGRGAGPA